jgi:hypothetical protein
MQHARVRTVLATAALIAVAATLVSVVHSSARAQPAWWPWSNSDRYERREREPGWRPAPQQQPPPVVQQGPQYPSASTQGRQNPICVQLEQRLVAESQRGNQSRDLLPKLEADLRQAERVARSAQAQLERVDCYDYFLFSKTLRRTRQCVDIANQADDAQRKLRELDTQRQQMLGTRDRSYQDDIIRELARNNCGASYQQEAARRGPTNPFASLWQDEDTGPGGNSNQFGALPFATYRTVCVRLCDGYYFPVSFSTLPNHFQRDSDLCHSKCAAPAELYYHQNPGGTVEQMVSASGNQPYTSLKSAFRYRKEYVQGCSCKQAEYSPSTERPDRKADTTPQPPTKQAQR